MDTPRAYLAFPMFKPPGRTFEPLPVVEGHVVGVYAGGSGQETLRRIIDERAGLALGEALGVGRQIAGVVGALHERGEVHGSLRPDTVLVLPDGGVIVEVPWMNPEAATAGQVEVSTGEAAYLSPEQVQGREADRRSDVYALGVILFEMLTGTVPFRADSAMVTAYQQVSGPPPRLDQVDGAIPAAVADMVERALAKHPADRYQSGDELAADLAEALHTLEPAAEPPPQPVADRDHPVPWPAGPDRQRMVMGSVLLLVIALSAVGILPTLQASDPPTPPSHAPPPGRVGGHVVGGTQPQGTSAADHPDAHTPNRLFPLMIGPNETTGSASDATDSNRAGTSTTAVDNVASETSTSAPVTTSVPAAPTTTAAPTTVTEPPTTAVSTTTVPTPTTSSTTTTTASTTTTTATTTTSTTTSTTTTAPPTTTTTICESRGRGNNCK